MLSEPEDVDPMVHVALVKYLCHEPTAKSTIRNILLNSAKHAVDEGFSIARSPIFKAMALYLCWIERDAEIEKLTLSYFDWLLTIQDEEGAFVDPVLGRTVRDTSFIICVSIIPTGFILTGRVEYLKAGIRAAKWVLRYQRSDGTFVDLDGEIDKTTVTSILSLSRFSYFLLHGKTLD